MWAFVRYCLCIIVFFAIESRCQTLEARGLQGIAAPSRETIRQILNKLERMRNPAAMTARDSGETNKCGLGLGFDVVNVWQYLNKEQKQRAALLLKPVHAQKETVIGNIRIHFDTVGVHEPALLDANGQRIPGTARSYVDSVGKYFNEVWSFEVDSLGYFAPPLEAGQFYYNVYVLNLQGNYYGQTWWDPDQPINPGQTPPRFATFIEIDNDFFETLYFSKGMEGLKVTAAHEFHHAIQLGSYGFWSRDIFFYEITSTWMEDVVYDGVNDYHQYIKTSSGQPRGHFLTPFRSFNVANGFIEYSRAIWGKYIEKRLDRSAMRQTWDRMRRESSLAAIDWVLGQHGSSLREAYSEFSLWNFFTADRADSVNFYSEAVHYPPIRLQDSLQFQPPLGTISPGIGMESLGAEYLKVLLNPSRTITVYPIIVKHNVVEAGNNTSERFVFTIRSDGGDNSYTQFQAEGATYWTKISGVSNSYDWTIIQPGVKVIPSSVVVYPNPFYAGQQNWIRFELPDDNTSRGGIYIFSSSMELVYSAEQDLVPSTLRSRHFRWDGESNSGPLAASGVYVYVLEAGSRQYTGKFTLIRK
jgi:hypothetical protein